MKKGIMKTTLAILGCIAALTIQTAKADTVLDITSDHATGGLGTAPFGTVTLAQNGANVDVTVHLLSGYLFVLTGAADFMDFKFNATGVALADISINQNALF